MKLDLPNLLFSIIALLQSILEQKRYDLDIQDGVCHFCWMLRKQNIRHLQEFDDEHTLIVKRHVSVERASEFHPEFIAGDLFFIEYNSCYILFLFCSS